MCTALILDLSSFHTIVSLPFSRTGPSTIAHQCYKHLTLTRVPIALATFLPLSTICTPHSNRVISTRITYWFQLDTITFLLFTLTFKPLLHTSTKRHTITFRSSSDLPHKTNSLHTRGQAVSTLSRPPKISIPPSPFLLLSLLLPYVEKPRGHDTTSSHTTINPETLALTTFYFYTSKIIKIQNINIIQKFTTQIITFSALPINLTAYAFLSQ